MPKYVDVTFATGIGKSKKTLRYPFDDGLEKHVRLDRTLTVRGLPMIVHRNGDGLPPIGAQVLSPREELPGGTFKYTFRHSGKSIVYFYEPNNQPLKRYLVDAKHLSKYIHDRAEPWLRATLNDNPRDSITLVDTRSGKNSRKAEPYNRANAGGRFAPYPSARARNSVEYGPLPAVHHVWRPHCGEHTLHLFMEDYARHKCPVQTTQCQGVVVDGRWYDGVELDRNCRVRAHNHFPRTVLVGWKVVMIGRVDVERFEDIAPAWRREATDGQVPRRNRGCDW